MPAYVVAQDWSAPILVAAGGIIQNTGQRDIWVCQIEPPHPDDSLLLAPGRWFTLPAASVVRVSVNGPGISRLNAAVLGGEIPDVAPVISVQPTITGATSPDGLLTLTPGAAAGYPAPSRAIAWLFNSTVLSGETGLTLDKAGRVGDFQGRVTWTNSEDSAVSLTNIITTEEAAQPNLTATLSPSPPVEGEVMVITFSAVPDMHTILLDGVAIPGALTDMTWTSAAPIGFGTVTIDAEKGGYTSAPITVQVQPAEIEPGGTSFEVIQQPDATFTVTADPEGGPILIDVTDPAAHTGQYTVDPADVEAQAPYWFASIIAPASVVAGQPVTAIPDIWIADAAGGAVTVAIEWRDAGGTPIVGLTSLTLTGEQTLEHDGETLTVAMIATNSLGSRTSTVAVEVAPYQLMPDTFTAPDGTTMPTYVGESGRSWIGGGLVIENGRVRTNASSSSYVTTRVDDLPPSQFAEGIMVVGSAPSDNGVGFVVRGDQPTRTGYYARLTGSRWYLGGIVNGSAASLPYTDATYPPETALNVRIEVRGDGTTEDPIILTLIVDGAIIQTGTPTQTILSGKPGVIMRGTSAAGVGNELSQFHAGELA